MPLDLLPVQLRKDAEELAGCGAGNEAERMRQAADVIESQQRVTGAAKMDDHEWVARVIRTVRMDAAGAPKAELGKSMAVEADDADLLAADIILCGLREPDPGKRLVSVTR